MKHVLVVGGTGMLFQATSYLAENSEQLTLIARKLPKQRLHSSKIVAFESVDYYDESKFTDAVKTIIRSSGKLTHVLCWMHSDALPSLKILLELAAGSVLWHVKGSSSYNPPKTDDVSSVMKDSVDYREIILGFKIENGISRWLTNEEISSGVINALQSDNKRKVIGLTEPWNRKPYI